VIIGAGPAGSATALLLARGGAAPLVIERDREPRDVVCGGFVSGDALRILSRLGISAAGTGAKPITHVRLILGRRQVEAALPFPAVGLSRRTLDALLIEAAERSGAHVERGLSARRLDARERRVALSDGAELEAPAVFLASGKHDVRGAPRTYRRGREEAVGFRAAITPGPSTARILDSVIELHLFDQGYAGLLLQEDGAANVCVSVSARRLRAAGGTPDRLVASLAAEAPVLAQRLADARELGAWSTVARVPYGFVAAPEPDGAFRVGDQAAVVASLVGDGVAVALDSAASASAAFLAGGAQASGAYQRGFARRAAVPIGLSCALRGLGEAPRLAAALFPIVRLQPGLLRLAAKWTRLGTTDGR